MNQVLVAVGIVATLLCAGCSGDRSPTDLPGTPNDGGSVDRDDAGTVDGGSSDAGRTDGGSSDAGQADAGSTDGGPPAQARQLTFSCQTYNIGVLTTQATNIQIPCSVTVYSTNERVIPNPDVRFLAEAGTMRFSSAPDGLFYFPRDPSALHVAPRDVDPGDLPGSQEPFRTTSNGIVHNPRDGLVTIIAWTPAPKSAVDAQGLSEPWVDANDNGFYEEGESYVDLNHNNQWDEQQDDDAALQHALWKKIKVLWTGTLQSSAPIGTVDPQTADVGYLQAQSFTLSLLDENFNVLAANDAAHDGVTWGYSPQPDISLASGQAATIKLYNPDDERRLGMLLDQNFNFIDPTSSFNWEMGGYVGVFVQDTMQCNTPLVAETFAVTGSVQRHLFLSAQGNPQGTQTETTLHASGRIEPPPSSNCSP